MQNKLIFFIILAFSVSKIYAQRYGSEWLNKDQKYFEFKIVDNKIHRINFLGLDRAFKRNGLSLQIIDPRRIQIFFRGKEIPIYIEGENDGEFNFDDYILFYGQRNDGYLDSFLYEDDGIQSNEHYSLYTDTSTYFLTYNLSSKGLRYTQYENTNYANFSPKEYYWHHEFKEYHDFYFQGTPLILGASRLYKSEYDGNEGRIAKPFGTKERSGSVWSDYISTKEKHKYTDSLGAIFSYKMVGVTDNFGVFNDHHVNLRIGGKVLFDTLFDDYGLVEKTIKVDGKLINNNQTLVALQEIAVPKVYRQSSAIAWMGIKYPHNTRLDGKLNFSYTIDNEDSTYYVWDEYGTSSQVGPIIFDINNNLIIKGEVRNKDELHYILPPLKDAKIVVTDTSIIPEIGVTAIDMKFPENMEKGDFLMVSHFGLQGDKVNGPLARYKNYRNGSHAPTLVFVEDLYRTFSHGIPSPIAIRRYCDYMIEHPFIDVGTKDTLKAKYLFLIGRGLESNLARFKLYEGQNNVPAFGVPSSDLMFTSGLGGTRLQPALSTGRLVADNIGHIATYLEKVQEYEVQNNSLWRKNILHLAGGKDGTQAGTIKAVMKKLSNIPITSTFAGNVNSISKSSEGVNQADLKQRAIAYINEGNSLITFLGHGSTSVLDLDIGDTNNYNNVNRYGIWYFNGCKVGNPNIGTNGGKIYLAEKVIRAGKKGGVAFIGQTSTSELYTLNDQMSIFYNILYNKPDKKYGIGDVMRVMIDSFQRPRYGLNRMHCRQLLLQGDPSLKPFNPTLPDFDITAGNFFIHPKNATALSDSFKLGVIIKNKGRFVPDSINAVLIRTYPNGVFKTYDTIMAKAIHFKDTIYFTLKSKDLQTRGNNKYEVEINYLKTNTNKRIIKESDYNNNKASRVINMPSNGVNPILPRKFAIVPNIDSVELIVQSSNLFIQNQNYFIEIDTSHNFNSPSLIKSSNINAGYLAKWTVPLLKDDSIVYYWRALLSTGATNGGFWVERSFTNIKNHAKGWDQSHFPQFSPKSDDVSEGLELDTLARIFKFKETEKLICVETKRSRFSNMGVHEGSCQSQDLNTNNCLTGLNVMLYHKNKLKLFLRKDVEPKCNWGRYAPPWHPEGKTETYQAYYSFDTKLSAHRTDFVNFINTLEDSTYVVIYSHFNTGISGWGKPMFDALNSIGSVKLNNVKDDGVSYVCIGRKGWSHGVAKEDTGMLIKGNNNWSQDYANVSYKIRGKLAEGSFITELIGPSKRWDSLIVNYSLKDYDRMHFSVIGHDGTGNAVELKDEIEDKITNLRDIDPIKYPYLQIKYDCNDYKENTAPQLDFWRVTYEGLPEGTLNPELEYVYHKDTLEEGDTFRIHIAFSNIDIKNFDSVYVSYQYSKRSTGEIIKEGYYMAKPLLLDSSIFFTNTLPTRYLNGEYTLLVSFNPGKQRELEYFNNSNLFDFYVRKDIVNPLLDVTFDGKHITNGEIVSSRPRILIMSKDENEFLWQVDSSKVYLELLSPGSSSFEKITMDDPRVEFIIAANKENRERIVFKPNRLNDGLYRLKVQTVDASDNQSGKQPYEISFNVINKSTVTNFYPYPNPFTTNMRFVFTLTGEEIPDEIHIKIMTLTGKVVREISKEELGTLRIGNNITNFAWDGTDQFGDRLANGVYLYHVSVKNAGKILDTRETKGDNAFKKGFGKIYLLR